MNQNDSIVLASGCFWCVEAIYSNIQGVVKVEPGYTGGLIPNPTYKEVCSGKTGHAEVVRIVFNPNKIHLSELLAVFFATHDPTTLNRQGGDVGTQYRSAIFPSSSLQKDLAEKAIAIASESGEWNNKIVTTIEELKEFYLAENYHHNYYAENEEAPYCSSVIAPKLQKFKKNFQNLLK